MWNREEVMINNKIRRKECAITDFNQMLEIMAACDVCRLGLRDDEGRVYRAAQLRL